MNIQERTEHFKKSQRIAAYSAVVFSILSIFINPSVAIVHAFCFVFACFNFEKVFIDRKIYLNIPIYTLYNYSMPILLTILLFSLIYLKYLKEEPTLITPMAFVLLFSPLIFSYQKVIMKVIDFPNDLSIFGLSNENYEITLDFQNKIYIGKNNLLEISGHNIIGLDLTLYELSENKIKFEEFIGKPISEATLSELQMAKLYHY